MRLLENVVNLMLSVIKKTGRVISSGLLFFILMISTCFSDSVVLVAVGDIMLGRHVDVFLQKKTLCIIGSI